MRPSAPRLATFALLLVTLTSLASASAAAAGPVNTQGPTIRWVADFSPFTRSPSIADLPDDGDCKPGRFECRWGGDCVKKGDQCYNCIEDYHWSDGMNSCYRCGEDLSLVQTPNGEWRCQD